VKRVVYGRGGDEGVREEWCLLGMANAKGGRREREKGGGAGEVVWDNKGVEGGRKGGGMGEEGRG